MAKPLKWFQDPLFWRPQAYALLLALLLLLLALLLPVAWVTFQDAQGQALTAPLGATGYPLPPDLAQAQFWLMTVWTVLVAGAAMGTAALLGAYKQHARQRRLLRPVLVLVLGGVALGLMLPGQYRQLVAPSLQLTLVRLGMGPAPYLCLAAVVPLLWALRRIAIDEKKLKQMDRFW